MAFCEDALIDAIQDVTAEILFEKYSRALMDSIVTKLKHALQVRDFWQQFVDRNDELVDYTVWVNHIDRELEITIKTANNSTHHYLTLTF